MAVTTNIPCTINPEATAHVAELGIQHDFDRMVEHTLNSIPELRRVEVILESASEDDDGAAGEQGAGDAGRHGDS